MTAPPLTWLYAPASRPELVEKALASEAHAVIVDLEDAVSPDEKADARVAAVELLVGPLEKTVYVRINGLATEWWEEDLAALEGLGITGIVLPKVDARTDVDRIPATWSVECLLESALGVLRAFEIASHPRVSGISLGEADLTAETGATELGWARSRVIFAAVAAGLQRPPQAVYTKVRDLDGLRISCAAGRALGHLGGKAIHPSQLPVIVEEYLPTVAEAHAAEELLAGGAGGRSHGDRFVDAAALKQAHTTLALAGVYGTTA